jgi:hypothetical protein
MPAKTVALRFSAIAERNATLSSMARAIPPAIPTGHDGSEELEIGLGFGASWGCAIRDESLAIPRFAELVTIT